VAAEAETGIARRSNRIGRYLVSMQSSPGLMCYDITYQSGVASRVNPFRRGRRLKRAYFEPIMKTNQETPT